MDVIKAVLEEKYPNLIQFKEHSVIKFGEFNEQRLIRMGCRMGKSTSTGNNKLTLYYLDREVNKQIVEEKASLVDKSNF